MTRPAASLRVAIVAAVAVLGGGTPLLAQMNEITGDAILKHPAGQLAVRAAGLLAAGKVDEVIALGPKSGQDEWKNASAEEREGVSGMKQRRAPVPATFADAIRKAGVLTINDTFAMLRVDLAGGDTALAYFEQEGTAWRLTNGPMVVAGASEPANETRIDGSELMDHPIAALAVQYVELLHAGKLEDAMRQLASSEAQEQWKAEPASERVASADYRKKVLPPAAELKSLLPSGVLIIEDGEQATLNIIKQEQRPTKPGTVEYSSTTITIPFVLEKGVWKLAR